MARYSSLVAMATAVLWSAIAVASAAVSRIDLGTTAQILATCRLTDYPDVCVETSKPVETTGPITVQRVARMSIEAAIDGAGKAKESAAAMMKADHGGERRQAEFRLCREEYVDAVSVLKASIKEMGKGIHDMLMDKLSAAATYSTLRATTPSQRRMRFRLWRPITLSLPRLLVIASLWHRIFPSVSS